MTPIKSELSRELSLFHITMMGVGMMIGAGVFVSTGIGIGVAGPGGILMAFALNGLLAFLSVMTYAELGSAIPHAGAGYSYVQQSIGGFTGFFSGWISWFAHAVAGSLYAITFAKYTIHFLLRLEFFSWLNLNLPLFEKVLAVLTALIFIYINYRGASETGTAGAVMAIGQTIVLGVIGLVGVYVAIRNPSRMGNFEPFLPNGWGKVLVVMGFSLVGYEGYEVIANTAEEVVDAKKNVPKGIFFAVMIVITTYLLVSFAAIVGVKASGMTVVDWFKGQGATGFADAIGQLLPIGGLLVTLAAIFASTSALNATIYSSTRISFALGRDGYLPRYCAHISRKNRTPNVALLLSGGVIIIIAAAFPVEVVCAGASLFFIVLFNLVTLAAIKIRIEQGDKLSYGYLMPLFPVIPVISFIGRLVIGVFLFDMGFLAYIIAGTWIGFGVILYFFYSKSNAQEIEQGKPLETIIVGSKGYQITVPVADPGTAPVLVRYANLLASGTDAEILITSVVTVPYQTPLTEAEKFTDEARALIHEMSRRVDGTVLTAIRYGHNVARGIISSVQERKTDLLILGWRGYTHWEHHAMGSTLDPVIGQAPCDIIVVKPDQTDPHREVKRVLFPLRGTGPHSELAVEALDLIAKKYNAEVTILHVLRTGKDQTDARDMIESIAEQIPDVRCSVQIVESDDPAISIFNESKNHDLLVIGATNETRFQRLLFGSVPEVIAKHCPSTVLMVKRKLGIPPWLRG
jgi:amino acid transporter/nucleotide-binding universal stress UspA family protein